jgi:hypothetical protein
MKKLILGLVIIFLGISMNISYAQTWYPANQVTVAWDASTKIAPTDVVKYQLYMRTGTTGDGTAVGVETEAVQALVTFSTEGRYYLGVKAIRYPAGETIGIPSLTTSWSNVAADTNNAPFGVIYYAAPIAPINLRKLP